MPPFCIWVMELSNFSFIINIYIRNSFFMKSWWKIKTMAKINLNGICQNEFECIQFCWEKNSNIYAQENLTWTLQEDNSTEMNLHGYAFERIYIFIQNYTQLLIQLDSSTDAQNEMNQIASMISFRHFLSVKYMQT